MKGNTGILFRHAKALKKSSEKYVIDGQLCKINSIFKGNCFFLQDNIFLEAMPKSIIIGLLKYAAMNGHKV